MRLKTYFSTGVEAAMLLALEQLGPDAMIVNSRRTTAENRHLGEYEVVFAVEAGLKPGDESQAVQSVVSSPIQDQETDAAQRLRAEVSRLASEIEVLGRTMKRAEIKTAVAGIEGEAAEVMYSLREAGFE